MVRAFGLGLAVAFCLAAVPAWGITVDGLVAPADEWDGAAVHFTDPGPEPPVGDFEIPGGYDVTDIFLTGGVAMYFRMDVLEPPLVLFQRGVYLRYDFAIDEDPGAAYGISFNDGLELERGLMHVVRFPDASLRGRLDMEYLGQGTFVSDDVLEAKFDWDLFDPAVVAGGRVTVNYHWWILESGTGTIDDGGEGPVQGVNLIVPEPLTAVGLLLGCGMLARRWIRGFRNGR